MVSSSKILTVSYGTFSCTLEGFDNSFDTMKAIAEYFRDLAQDDRYFGAEPPTPDAEMLARIAEREIERRVEARMENGSYVLRPRLSAPGPDRTATAAAPQPERQYDRAAAPQVQPQNAAQPDSAARTLAQTTAARVQDAFEEDAMAPVADPAPVVAPAPVPADANSVAAKLQRIRAVVSASRGSPGGVYSEDEPAEEFNLTSEDSALAEPPVDVTACDAQEDTFDSSAVTTFTGSLGTPDEVAEAATTEDATPTPDATAADEQDEDGDIPDLDLSGFSLPADDIAQAAKNDIAPGNRDDDKGLCEDDGGNLFVETVAAGESDAGEPAVTTASAAATGDAAELPNADAAARDQSAAQKPTRARVVRVKRMDITAAVASGTLEEMSEADTDAPVSSLTPEQEADLARELAEVAAELNEDLDEDDDWDEENSRLVAATVAGLKADPAAPSAPSGLSDEAREDRNAEPEDEAGDKEPPAAQDEDRRDQESELDHAVERMARDGIRKAVKMSSPARVMLTENTIEEDDTAVDRILDETNTQLQEPEGNRRRSAIAHLRAAVAATRADRILGRRKDPEKEAEPYRADLATVVRPRRPETGAGARLERPSELRPAPLKLVAEQRVDDARQSVEPAAAAIRPRRVTREDIKRDPLDLDETNGGFAEFARNMGASDLSELLEAAAAYLSFVEGRDQFSRPQLMTKVRAVESAESSREDRLRSFGQLLREGKIEKTRGGRFTASERISFKPGARAVG